MADLAHIIANAREEAQIIRSAGNAGQADYVDRLLDQMKESAEDFTHWLSEAEAMIKSGLEARTLRRRFRWLKECGLARYGDKGRREYLACSVPQRADPHAAYAEGLKPTEELKVS